MRSLNTLEVNTVAGGFLSGADINAMFAATLGVGVAIGIGCCAIVGLLGFGGYSAYQHYYNEE
jgi:hypothetical protein